MKNAVAGLLVGAGFLAAAPVQAHHSFAAEYSAAKPVTLTGVVAKVEWTNPHLYFYLDVKDRNGATGRWAFEAGSPNTLLRAGWQRESLKPGDTITVDAYPARDGSNRAMARSIRLADGRKVLAVL